MQPQVRIREAQHGARRWDMVTRQGSEKLGIERWLTTRRIDSTRGGANELVAQHLLSFEVLTKQR